MSAIEERLRQQMTVKRVPAEAQDNIMRRVFAIAFAVRVHALPESTGRKAIDRLIAAVERKAAELASLS